MVARKILALVVRVRALHRQFLYFILQFLKYLCSYGVLADGKRFAFEEEFIQDYFRNFGTRINFIFLLIQVK